MSSSPYFSRIPEFLAPLFQDAENPWEALPKLSDFLRQKVQPENLGVKVGDVYIDHDVCIGEGTVIEHGAMIKGPCYIGKNCQIRSGAYLRGSVYVGDNCIVGHAVEMKNAILFDNSALAHFNYTGDSIIGSGVNLGGGAILANFRFDKKGVRVGQLETGLKKLGAILGDDSQLGCNTVLNPGTVFEKGVVYAGKPLKSGIYAKDEKSQPRLVDKQVQ